MRRKRKYKNVKYPEKLSRAELKELKKTVEGTKKRFNRLSEDKKLGDKAIVSARSPEYIINKTNVKLKRPFGPFYDANTGKKLTIAESKKMIIGMEKQHGLEGRKFRKTKRKELEKISWFQKRSLEKKQRELKKRYPDKISKRTLNKSIFEGGRFVILNIGGREVATDKGTISFLTGAGGFAEGLKSHGPFYNPKTGKKLSIAESKEVISTLRRDMETPRRKQRVAKREKTEPKVKPMQPRQKRRLKEKKT